ncbi:MAG: carbonic anhydrase family protein [Saprospiraceae bacterium]|nr:carbonic anhydrase family protein [Saprospiraceae bacterium]MCF8248709.1 carbonic anhydrase family protein [Saprospiraceae bacterium]MCF8278801.1 carbonic anhydrase family protein [Bacteroidales bacterium]MCF8310601.1 carbonic anhydrase family protein [Saprospiraceae bacterium]MCF8439160.1 carbonic anhydrase family protein [Saprospiraceae bacterium]
MSSKHPFFKISAGVFFAAALSMMGACTNESKISESVEPQAEINEPYLVNDFTGEITLRTDCEGTNIHWEYEGIDGPDYWEDICNSWDCGGNHQSPVNIIPPASRNLAKKLRFYWKNTATFIVNNGHTIQYNVDQPANLNEASYISLNGQKFYLLQFHFHAESEHTVNGVHYPVEIHFVHRNPIDGQLAVVGVFIEEGNHNPFFDDIMTSWPHDEGDFASSDTYNPKVLMPAGYNSTYDAHFWWYGGSLTTPPCSEIVNWMVWSTNIEASHEQIAEMEAILHENYRPTQPLNNRLVKAQ